jgi:hypothetical protein
VIWWALSKEITGEFVNVLSCEIVGGCSNSDVLAIPQMITVPSSLAEAKRFPDGLNLT